MERVATLWIGKRFSFLEHLCLKSFADVDQKLIVYHYGDLEDIPDYIEVRDAREIYDAPEIYRDPINRSVAVHADLFRLKLLQKTDYIWVDADIYALRPLTAKDGYLFPLGNKKNQRLINSVMAFPNDSPSLQAMCDFAFDSDLVPPWWPDAHKQTYLKLYGKSTYWSLPLFSLGPPMLYYFISQSGEMSRGVPRAELYALPPRFRHLWNDPDMSKLDFLDWQNKMSIHFHGSWFRKIFADVQSLNRGALVDHLLRKHQIDPNMHPI